MSLWHKHPGVKSGSDLTIGQRAADQVRNGMGSWPFIFIFLAAMGLWAGYNKGDGFDPYPFILLNLLLSTMAGMQGAILLIAAKRADQVSSELAVHTFDIDREALDLIKEVHELSSKVAVLTQAIHDHIGATP